MIHLDNRQSIFNLNTEYPTIVLKNYPINDPNVIDQFMKEKCLREHHISSYSKKITPHISFIKDIASNLLDMYHFDHCKSIWYMDLIRYELNNESKPSNIPPGNGIPITGNVV